MKRFGRLGLSTTALSVALLLTTAPAWAQSMTEALASAYATNPDLAADIANLKSVNEGVAQALSNYRPTVSAQGSIGSKFNNTTRDAGPLDTITNSSGRSVGTRSEGGRKGDPLSNGGTEGNWHEVNPATLGITASQSIYNGGQTEAMVNQAENMVQATRAVVQTTEQTVLLNAATAYADVVQAQAALDVRRANESQLGRQLQATRDRFNVGEVTRTEVSQAEAARAGGTAGRIQAEGDLRSARARFEQVIGQQPGTLDTPAVPGGLPPSLQTAIQKAQSSNPGIIAALFSERAAADNIDLQYGALLPQLTLQASVERQYTTVSHPNSSSGAQSRIDSAVIVAQLSIPLYSGGNTESKVRAARYTQGQKRIQIETQRRSAIQSAVQSWETLVTARAAIKSFQAQVKAEQLAVDGLQQETAVGSATVLDVLTEQQNLLSAQLSLVQSRRNEVVAGYQLLNATGILTARDLGLPVKVYDPEPDYQVTRARWFGTSVDE